MAETCNHVFIANFLFDLCSAIIIIIIIIIKKDIYCPTYNKLEWPGIIESIKSLRHDK